MVFFFLHLFFRGKIPVIFFQYLHFLHTGQLFLSGFFFLLLYFVCNGLLFLYWLWLLFNFFLFFLFIIIIPVFSFKMVHSSRRSVGSKSSSSQDAMILCF